MPFRASFKCCAMTTISSSAAGDPEPPEFASESAASPANAAWAGERGPNKHRKDAATPEAAARIEKLNMRTAPQKLIDDEPRPIARAGNCGVDRTDARLRTELGVDADEERDVKRVTESGRNDLRKRGTLRAARVEGAVRLNSKLGAADAGQMTEFVNHGTLLCHQQQQQ